MLWWLTQMNFPNPKDSNFENLNYNYPRKPTTLACKNSIRLSNTESPKFLMICQKLRQWYSKNAETQNPLCTITDSQNFVSPAIFEISTFPLCYGFEL